jgi:5-methylcytosine-specific restriction endonuclease McrA
VQHFGAATPPKRVNVPFNYFPLPSMSHPPKDFPGFPILLIRREIFPPPPAEKSHSKNVPSRPILIFVTGHFSATRIYNRAQPVERAVTAIAGLPITRRPVFHLTGPIQLDYSNRLAPADACSAHMWLTELLLSFARLTGGTLRFELEPHNLNVPDADLLTDLRAFAARYPSSHPSWHRYNKEGRFGAETLRRRFGSWNTALLKAGLGVTKRARFSEEELFENMEAVWRTLGRQPRYRDFDAVVTNVSRSAYERRFGSWRAALEAFVTWANASQENDEAASPLLTERARRTSREPSLRLRFHVMRRDDFKCRQCGRSPAMEAGVILHIDHVLAWSLGGETTFENLRTLCDRCNLGNSCLPASEG